MLTEEQKAKRNARQRAYYLANKEKCNAQSKAYYEANKERLIEVSAEWQKANPEKRKEASRKWYENTADKLKLQARTLEWQKAARLKKAGRSMPDLCEACHQPSNKTLHFDHCHTTGNFRGWICHFCNSTLGFVKDSTEKLEALIRYLERSRREVAA